MTERRENQRREDKAERREYNREKRI